jgi:hypothetical protein
MRRGWLNRATMLSLALVLIVSGCEHSVSEPQVEVQEQSLEEVVTPAEVSPLEGGVVSGGYTLIRLSPASDDVQGTDTSQGLLGGLLKLVGKVLSLVIKIIGLDGGLLTLQNHSLLVPPGAVTQPTTFRMELVPNRLVMVDLEATRRGRDVGADGFGTPVTLTLSYKDADVRDPSKLFILRYNENGEHERLPSVVNTTNKTVSAQLDHFSRYCMATN